MWKTLSGSLLIATLGLTLLAPPAAAAEHDRDCMPAGQFFNDAGNDAAMASRLGAALGATCTGEMLQNVDNDDWYWYRVSIGSTVQAASLTVCPAITKTGPWETSIEIYLRPNVNNFILNDIIGSGVKLGSSANAGCDTVTASLPAPVTNARVLFHVHRDSGDGLYSFTANAS